MTNFFEKSADTPDLSSVNLLIVTPCGDGKYESTFMASLFNTTKEIERLGGKAAFYQFLYCSDIALARNKLIGFFYKSDYTHVLFVDSDMGWDEKDAIRLILEDQEFVGAVGCKKKYPIEFAANCTHDDGRLKQLVQTGDLVEVTEIGMAFVLLSRSCVEKMIKAYEYLSWYETQQDKEYGLFETIIENNKRYSEDFSFCRRWRKIGGKIMVLPDVVMKHTGSHTFQGSFEDYLVNQEMNNGKEGQASINDGEVGQNVGVRSYEG